VTTDRTWAEVDHYFGRLLLPEDPVLDGALAASARAGLPVAQVSALQGQLLFLIATMISARRILEIGTLGGYSTIHLARALPADGRLITLEASERHAAVAAANLADAGLSDRVEVVVGPALETLPSLEAGEPFDLVFLDADKVNNHAYLEWSMRLTRTGSVIVADNVVRGGDVLDGTSIDPSVVGVRRFAEVLGADPRLVSTAIQTVGSKGYDGFALALRAEVDDKGV
jgi:predicted O-methyltransferase YrrM